MPNWTKEQQAAIDARGCNLLVAAAAGSGKTAVLVERITQLLLKDGVDIDRLLVVTFTNAAAGEMRERIGAALLKAIDEDIGEDSAHLRRQLNLLPKAFISTIHSFCMQVIRKYFHVIHLDPGFRIGDETECQLLKLEVMEELLESEYEKGNPNFLGLVERFSDNRQDAALQELVLNLHSFTQSKPFPQAWLEDQVQNFALEMDKLDDSPWVKTLLSSVIIEIQGIVDLLSEALILCEKPFGPEPYRENILDDLQQINGVLMPAAGKSLSALQTAWGQINFSRLKTCRKDAGIDENLKKKVRDLRERAKKALAGLGGGILKSGLEQNIKQLNELYPYMQYLCDLVKEFDKQYKKQKQEKGIIDYNDQEHYALEILQHESVAEELKEKYDYIFVDEYQDSNLVQETILSYISRGNNMFMVGDVKQSIYRFRLADPSIFLEKYGIYSTKAGSENYRIDLNRNFRSRPNILSGVNYLFENIMSAQLGEMEYDEKAALYPGLEPPEAEDEAYDAIELHLIEKNEEMGIGDASFNDSRETEDDEDSEMEETEELIDLSDIEVEASIAADLVQQLIGTKIYDPKMKTPGSDSESRDFRQGGYRELEYRDIVLLLRTTKNWASVFQDVFTARGIPVYVDSNTGYFEAQEVKTIISLLKIIDNKFQDIPLLTVMRSPIGGFDADDMIRIRTAGTSRAFYQAAMEYADKKDDELALRLKGFYEKIRKWQEAVRYLPMEDFIWKLYTESGYLDYVGAMPGGFQRQANLRILLERARQFQQTSVQGLFQFIRFIDRLQRSNGDMGAAKTLGEKENVLRIMSVHKSKGLEFPVVILAGLGKQFNMSDIKGAVLFHKDLGLGPRYVNPETRQTCDTLAKISMKHVMRMESLSEEMRVLYVALTRARERLILLGSARDLRKTAVKWTKPVSPYSLSGAKNYLDWIGPVLMRHPDCDTLRALSNEEFTQDFWLHDSSWKVIIHKREDAAAYMREQACDQREFIDWLKNPEDHIRRLSEEKVSKGQDQKVHEVDEESTVYDYAGVADKKEKEDKAELEVERLRGIIEGRFSWKYPYSYASNIPSKMTVTEISKLQGLRGVSFLKEAEEPAPSMISREDDFFGKSAGFTPNHISASSASLVSRPRFLEGSKRFTAAEKGTIIHFILQHMDLKRADNEEDILIQIKEMTDRELLTKDEAEAADLGKILGFLKSDIGKRIRRAEDVRREVPFNLSIRADEMFEGLPSGEDTLLIQGVMDCIFEEEGKWVLVDYKTDYIDSEEKLSQVIERYRTQMDLYALALEQITGRPVKEKILYLLHINRGVNL